MQIKTVALVGLGAIGCTVAPDIQTVLGFDNMRVIAGGARGARLKEQGVTVNGTQYHFNIVAPEEQTEPADLVLLAVKHQALTAAVADMANQVGPNTILLSLMNGIDSQDRMADAYGREKVLRGLCITSAINMGGNFTFAPADPAILFGEDKNQGAYSPKVQAVADLFTAAGLAYQIPEDMVYEQWFKFMLNVGGNCSNTLLRGSHSYFQELASANAARRMLMEEVQQVSEAMGTGMTVADVDSLMGFYHRYPGKNICSMLQDLEAGRHTENEMLCGQVVEMGKACGVPTPVNQYVFYMLDALNQVSAGALKE